MPGASVEALRRFRAGEPGAEAAPSAIISALRKLGADQTAKNKQFAIDSEGLAQATLATGDPNPRGLIGLPEAAQQRMQDYVGDQMNVGGVTSWHGSPHVIDRFDATKIGTGEGAQAMGYGHYSGEKRGVGQAYADSVTNFRNDELPRFLVGSQPFTKENPMHTAALAVDNNQGRVNDAVHEIWDAHVNRKNYEPFDRLDKWQAESAIDYLRRYGAGNLPKVTEPTLYNKNLYKLDIPDEHVDRMLNWDKGIYEQRPEVLDALGWRGGKGALDDMRWEASQGMYGQVNRIAKENGLENPLFTGGMLHRQMQSDLGSERAASSALANKGLSGTYHLDAYSRNRDDGMTRNFVVFPESEDIIKILGRETIGPNEQCKY